MNIDDYTQVNLTNAQGIAAIILILVVSLAGMYWSGL